MSGRWQDSNGILAELGGIWAYTGEGGRGERKGASEGKRDSTPLLEIGGGRRPTGWNEIRRYRVFFWVFLENRLPFLPKKLTFSFPSALLQSI